VRSCLDTPAAGALRNAGANAQAWRKAVTASARPQGDSPNAAKSNFDALKNTPVDVDPAVVLAREGKNSTR